MIHDPLSCVMIEIRFSRDARHLKAVEASNRAINAWWDRYMFQPAADQLKEELDDRILSGIMTGVVGKR